MNIKLKTIEEIDEIVAAEAGDDSAWGKPVRVRKAKRAAVPLPAELAARAAFFARLHHAPSVEDWVARVLQDRIDIEEAAFAELKRELIKR